MEFTFPPCSATTEAGIPAPANWLALTRYQPSRCTPIFTASLAAASVYCWLTADVPRGAFDTTARVLTSNDRSLPDSARPTSLTSGLPPPRADALMIPLAPSRLFNATLAAAGALST